MLSSFLTFGLWGYSFYVTPGYYNNLFSNYVVFCAVLSVSAREKICTYIVTQVTFVTLYVVPNFYVR